MAEDQQFYVGQKVVLEKDGKVLLLHDSVLGADLPGGKIQIGETDFTESLKREVFEETGLTIEVGQPFYTGLFSPSTNLKYRNAGKLTFLLFFTATYVSGEVTLSNEHDSYLWVDKNDYKNVMDETGNIQKALDKYFSMK